MPRFDVNGELIKILALEQGIKMNKLIEISGISRTMFYRHMDGETPMDKEIIEKIANKLNIPPMELIK